MRESFPANERWLARSAMWQGMQAALTHLRDVLDNDEYAVDENLDLAIRTAQKRAFQDVKRDFDEHGGTPAEATYWAEQLAALGQLQVAKPSRRGET